MLIVLALIGCRKDPVNEDSGAGLDSDLLVIDEDGDGFDVDNDCDDSDPAVNPDAAEICDGIDNDCDTDVDEDVLTTLYADRDGDGFGDAWTPLETCETAVAGYVEDATDCNDSDADYNPNASEDDCTDPNDYNCDGSVGYEDGDGDGYPACEDCDDTEASINEESTFYADTDGDGFGDEDSTTEACEASAGWVANDADCDDADDTSSPTGTEVCDDADNDCDGDVDEDATDATTWYDDGDNDGYGDPGDSEDACDAPEDHVADATDCDDGDDDVHPGADEVCNDEDDDCDGDVDEDAVDGGTFYADSDSDGYGDSSTSETACEASSGYVSDDTDCDDTDGDISPAGTEVCDGEDNDCDGDTDWGLVVGSDYTTIQDAVDAAGDGDTICVDAGTYTEVVDIDGKAITLQGAGSSTTTIDGDGDGPVIEMSSRETGVTISGFTITGGEASQGAAVYMERAEAALDDVVIELNSSISSTSSYAYGVVYLEDSELEMTDSEISTNDATDTYVYGAALYLTGSDASLTDVDVTGNVATASSYLYGSAIYTSSDSFLEWEGGSISGNEGVGYYYAYGTIYSYGELDLSQVAIAGNDLEATYYYGYGGGIYGYGEIKLRNTIVAGNTVYGYYYARGGALYGNYGSEWDIENVDIVGNIADSGYYDGCGGGLYSYYTDWTITNTNIVFNDAGGEGDGLCGYYPSGYGYSSYDITYSNVYGNGSDDFYQIADLTGTDGNISADPDYVDYDTGLDAEDWDLTLDTGSASIDAGTGTDTDGSTADIGAYGGSGGSW